MKNLKILLALAALLAGGSLFADVVSPMAIFTKVGIDQAQTNFIPAAIVWILLLTGAMSAMMQKLMPFIVGCICCLIMALAPDIATSFSTFDFYTTGSGVDKPVATP